MCFSEHIDTILNRTELTRELLRKIQGLESRRDQEEGGGAGLRKLDYTLLHLFLNCCATDIVFVTQFRTAVETANSEVHELPRSAKVPTTVTLLLFWRWLTVSSVFAGRIRADELLAFSPHPTPPHPTPLHPTLFPRP